MWYVIPPATSGSTPGSPPCWAVLENLQWKVPRMHPNQVPEPPRVASFSFPRMSKLLTLSPAWAQPAYGQTLFFQSLPRAHCHRWGSVNRSTGKWKALPSGSVPSSLWQSRKCQNYCWSSSNPPAHLPLHPPLVNISPKLKLLHLGLRHIRDSCFVLWCNPFKVGQLMDYQEAKWSVYSLQVQRSQNLLF